VPYLFLLFRELSCFENSAASSQLACPIIDFVKASDLPPATMASRIVCRRLVIKLIQSGRPFSSIPRRTASAAAVPISSSLPHDVRSQIYVGVISRPSYTKLTISAPSIYTQSRPAHGLSHNRLPRTKRTIHGPYLCQATADVCKRRRMLDV
jgi:hypothetical protein